MPTELRYDEHDHIGGLDELFQTADHREGVAAFREKRPAHYEGR